MTRPTVAGSTPASATALRAASVAIETTVSSSPAMPRAAMPVRCWIHSSLVSRAAGSSSLVIDAHRPLLAEAEDAAVAERRDGPSRVTSALTRASGWPSLTGSPSWTSHSTS